jgi:hypothetical protein
MTRKQEFKMQVASKPIQINDSRFGLRKFFLNPKERPRIKTYQNPGKGASGESQT